MKYLSLQTCMSAIGRLSILFTLLVLAAGCSKNSLSKIQKSKDVEYKLRMAEKFYAGKKYNKAQILYEELFPLLKNDTRFEDLYYKYAYCAYNLRDYMNAENLFKGYIDAFPKSPRVAEADFMRAYCFYRQSPKVELDQTNTQRTIGLMQAFINNYPESPKVQEARDIIDKCYEKLELKEFKSAELYYNLGSYRAAAITFSNLLNHYPESKRGDEYKLMVIKSYYQYAVMSIETKQVERYEQVIAEYYDFVDRFPDSKYLKEAEKYFNLTSNNLKALKNEQTVKKS